MKIVKKHSPAEASAAVDQIVRFARQKCSADGKTLYRIAQTADLKADTAVRFFHGYTRPSDRARKAPDGLGRVSFDTAIRILLAAGIEMHFSDPAGRSKANRLHISPN